MLNCGVVVVDCPDDHNEVDYFISQRVDLSGEMTGIEKYELVADLFVGNDL